MSRSPTGDQTEARKFTRRQFVGRAAALGLSVSALPALSGLLDPVVAAASTRAPDRKRGGILRIGETGNFENFDPQSEPGGDWPFFNQLYGSLSRDTMQPNAGASEMWLASGYKFGPGYKYVDITLRDGVKFIDGSPLNSAALLANLKKIMNPVTGRDAYADWATIISSYRAVDEKTTRLYFKGARQMSTFVSSSAAWNWLARSSSPRARTHWTRRRRVLVPSPSPVMNPVR